MATKRISRREAARDFDALVGTLEKTKEPVIVEDAGKVVAVVLSPEEFEAWERADFEALLDELGQANADKDPDQLLADVTRVVDEVRQERYAQQHT